MFKVDKIVEDIHEWTPTYEIQDVIVYEVI